MSELKYMSFDQWIDKYYPDERYFAFNGDCECPVCCGSEGFEFCNACDGWGTKRAYDLVKEYREILNSERRIARDIGVAELPLFS